MGAMKQILIGRMQARLSALAAKTGYDIVELCDLWDAYEDECREDGEPTDWSYFEEVTLECDW